MTTIHLNHEMTCKLPQLLHGVATRVVKGQAQAAHLLRALKQVPGYLVMAPIAMAVGSLILVSMVLGNKGN